MKSRKPRQRPVQRKSKARPTQNLHNDRPITLEITDLSRGGAGFGRDEKGRAVFVPFTMAGDHVKVKLTKAKSKFAEGYVMEIITPSPERIEARCEVFGQCGGCQWQHIPYPQQWETKQQGVLNSLSLNNIKLDSPKHPVTVDAFPAENIWHYRNRVQLRGFKDEIGFYANQSNELVPIEQCHIAHPHINDALTQTKAKAQDKKFKQPYKVELNLTIDGDVSPTWNDEHASSGFRQVNDEQNDTLKKWIADTIPHTQPLLDLYGGSGNLSQQFIDQVDAIHCVDLSTPNNENDVASLGENFTFHRASVEKWLKLLSTKQLLAKHSRWTALIDPPREGLGKNGESMVEVLKKYKVKNIVLVGCKTDPWSRDIALFIQHGWTLKKIAMLDFFPQTYHVESVAYLVRK